MVNSKSLTQCRVWCPHDSKLLLRGCVAHMQVFIKTPAVLAANPHPIAFQLYKSSVVFLTSFVFLIYRAAFKPVGLSAPVNLLGGQGAPRAIV